MDSAIGHPGELNHCCGKPAPSAERPSFQGAARPERWPGVVTVVPKDLSAGWNRPERIQGSVGVRSALTLPRQASSL